jgi:hypothetical protein
MIHFQFNRFFIYLGFALFLIVSSIFIIRFAINVYAIILLLGLGYIPFCRIITNVTWLNSIWISFVTLAISIALTILIVDIWVVKSPDGISLGIRPIFVPIFNHLSFINNEYDLSDFLLILRIILNSLFTLLLFELVRMFKIKNN